MSVTATVTEIETLPYWTTSERPHERRSTEGTSSKNGANVIAMQTFRSTPILTMNAVTKEPETTLEIGSPSHETFGGVPVVTYEMRKRETIVLSAMCFVLFLEGWNDGAIGPLLPRIQSWYGVSYYDFDQVTLTNFTSFCRSILLQSPLFGFHNVS
jgi:hypothetical protein